MTTYGSGRTQRLMVTLPPSPSPGQALVKALGSVLAVFTGSCAFVKCGGGAVLTQTAVDFVFPLKYFSWWLVNWEGLWELEGTD